MKKHLVRHISVLNCAWYLNLHINGVGSLFGGEITEHKGSWETDNNNVQGKKSL